MKRKIMKTILTVFVTLTIIFLSFSNVLSEEQKPEIFIQLGHPSNVTSVAFSPDGHRIVSSGFWDGIVKIWDTESGREIRTFLGINGMGKVAFSRDRRSIITGGVDGSIKLWDTNSGQEIRSFKGHSANVTSVAFLPDGCRILTGSEDGIIKLWKTENGSEIRSFKGHSDSVLHVTFSPDSRYILSRGARNGIVDIWDMDSGQKIRTFRVSNLSSVVFSPDGRSVLSGSRDGTIKLCDVVTGQELRTFSGHSNIVLYMMFSPDGHRILSGSTDKTTKLWDSDSGHEIRTFPGLASMYSVAFSSDGRVLAESIDGTIKLWDTGVGSKIQTFSGYFSNVISVAFSPDDHSVLSGSSDGIIKLWDVKSGQEIRTFTGYFRGVDSVAYSPDGRYVISGSTDTTIKLWNAEMGHEKLTFRGHSMPVRSVSISPDGRSVLSGSSDATVKLWDMESGQELRTFKGHTGSVSSVAFSPDGHRFLSASSDNTLRLWDVDSGRELFTFTEFPNLISSIAFSPDGRFVVAGRQDKTLKLWDALSGRGIRTFSEHAAPVISVAFSPDGRFLLSGSGDKTLKLWDIDSGRVLRTFSGHSSIVTSVAFSPNGQHILSGSADRSVKLWDIYNGLELRTFSGISGFVSSLVFSPDGRHVLSGSRDYGAKLWDVNSGKEIAQFVSFSNGEWVSITSEGYFNASKNGPSHINVRMSGNRVFGLDQFYDVFYRPDIVEAKLKGEDITSLASTNLEEALRNPPPMVEFLDVPSKTGDQKVTIKYRVTGAGGGIGEIRLFHNGKLIRSDGYYRLAKTAPAEKPATLLAYNARAIKDDLRGLNLVSKKEDHLSLIESAPKGDVYEGTIIVDAMAGENDIGLAAFNKNNSVQSILKTATFHSTMSPEEPHLYILAVGIDEYKAKENNLKYAVKDAEIIVQKLREQSQTQYRPENIHVVTIKNHDASKANILRKISELSSTVKPNDIFMLFFASHGVLQSGLYSIVTSDYNGNLDSGNLINSNEIMDISKKIKALSQIFIFDTCHAGGIDTFISGLYDARMTVMARNMGLHMFASASSTQEALDGYQGKNGMFTYALVEGLSNNRNTDANKDGKVSINELGSYSKEKTVKYSKESGHSQTPVIKSFGKDISVYVIRE